MLRISGDLLRDRRAYPQGLKPDSWRGGVRPKQTLG